jgi:uncharacterized membrane protein
MQVDTKPIQQDRQTDEESRRLAGVLGPTIMVLTASEAMNYRIFDAQLPTVVYLDGLFLFVAGLVIVRRHNRWTWSWPVLNTILGWAIMLGGLSRMFAPEAQQPQENMAMEAFLVAGFVVGCCLTYEAYRRSDH